MALKETLQEANYRMVSRNRHGEYLLFNNGSAGFEIWVANKNHANYGLKWRNTHLEFARSYNEKRETFQAVD